MKILQQLFVLGGLALFLLCLVSAFTIKQVTAPPEPTTTLQPTPAPASVVKETFDGLVAIGVGDSVRSGARANDANTQAVHTSKVGQFVQDIMPLVPLCIATILAVSPIVIIAIVLGFWRSERNAKYCSELTGALSKRLAEIEQRAKDLTEL